MPTPPVDLRPWFLTFADLEPYLDTEQRIDWTKLFGNANPVELDIGCGRGLFLVNAAVGHPQTNFLGMEVDYKEGRHGARRLQKRTLPNARVLGGDARFALDTLVRPGSADAAHVYFPDPWWKRKHKRRRLFTEAFVTQLATVVRPGGLVHSWTDVEDYFTVIGALLDNDSRFEKLPPPDERPPENDLDYQTSFERKKRQAGETIYRGLWRRG
jgi:tRNA (guanine-N7-)-methyltransferase